MPINLRAPSDGELLKEVSAQCSKILGKTFRFESRGKFYEFFASTGMHSLVARGAMKPLRAPISPDTALELCVAMLRLSSTRRPAETYSRRLEQLQRYSADEHPRAPQGEPTVVNGKTYLPGEFIPHSEIHAETKALETKLASLRGIVQQHRAEKAASAAVVPAARNANAPAIAAEAKRLFETAGQNKNVIQDSQALQASLHTLGVPDIIAVAEATGMRWGKKPSRGGMIQQIIARIEQQRGDAIRHGDLAY